jgi:ribosome-associated heat shock protein Hsp15
MRLDQWLWAVRLYKTRTLAADAIKGGRVKLNGDSTKPAREVHAGEFVTARTGDLTRTYRVIASPPARVSAKLVPQFAEDLTPAAELVKPQLPGFVPPARRPRGAGRPTKRERRALDQLDL